MLLATGWSAEQVAEILEVDANTVRNHFKASRRSGLNALRYVACRGSAPALNEPQLAWLDAHLQRQLNTTAKALAAVVEAQFDVRYTER